MYCNPELIWGFVYPRRCDELCIRIQLQASLGGRLGRFVIVTMVQVRHYPVVCVVMACLAACKVRPLLALPAAEIFRRLL